jgi:YtkA-like
MFMHQCAAQPHECLSWSVVGGRWSVVRRRHRLLLVLLLAFLTACGGSGMTQTAQTEHYTVQLSLDGAGFGQREATVDVHDAAGKPVAADQVVLASVMRQMGMAAPEAVAQPVASGRYRATGEFFSMIGEWEVDVRVDAGGTEEVATFKIAVTQ